MVLSIDKRHCNDNKRLGKLKISATHSTYPTYPTCGNNKNRNSTTCAVTPFLLFATLFLLCVSNVLGAPAASGGTLEGDTKRKGQTNACLDDRKIQVSEQNSGDGPYRRYDGPIYGGDTCCGADEPSKLTDNLIASTGASMRGLFGLCGQCAETWELLFFAAACSPQQASFLKKLGNDTYYTLFITKELALSLWDSCKEDDELSPKPGVNGRPLKYVYKNVEGVSWNTPQLKAKYFVEDTNMRHTPPLYLAEASERLHIKVASDEFDGKRAQTEDLYEKYSDTAMDETNLKVGFRVKPYCAESGHPITEVAISIMIRLLLLFVGTWLANFLHLRHVTWLPESGVFIVFGLIYGSIILAVKGDAGALDLAFDATLLNLILLPPIIFYSGFSMHHSNFGANLNEILVLAVVGTLVSTFGTGFALVGVKDMGIGDFPSTINLWESLAFAALVSAVDPVATLATFDALQVDPNVEVLIFGESLLNDAVAIVLYKSFAQFAERGGVTPEFGYVDALLTFVTLSLGSILVGFGMTVLQALVFKYTFFKHTPVLEILTFMFLAYSSFIIAEYFHWSGIIASLGHGIGCALFVKPNMSQEGHFRAELISHSLAALADMLIFIMVGYSGVQTITSVFDVSWALTIITLFLALVLRALSTFSLIPILNCCRAKDRQIGMNEAFLMWWSGLRGAIAIGLVAAIPSPLRSQMMATTCLIVFFTVFVLGGGTAKVLEKTGIKMGINKPEAHGTLGNGCMAKLYKVMIRLITNQDENDDGIDDRYQSTSYNREMTRRGSIISSSGLDRSGTINVLQSDDLKLLQEKQNAEKELYPDKEKEQVSSEDAERNAKSTLNWE